MNRVGSSILTPDEEFQASAIKTSAVHSTLGNFAFGSLKRKGKRKLWFRRRSDAARGGKLQQKNGYVFRVLQRNDVWDVRCLVIVFFFELRKVTLAVSSPVGLKKGEGDRGSRRRKLFRRQLRRACAAAPRLLPREERPPSLPPSDCPTT